LVNPIGLLTSPPDLLSTTYLLRSCLMFTQLLWT
jgi:hypothetical protein